MQSKHILASVMLSTVLVSANASAADLWGRWGRGEHGVRPGPVRATPEFGAGAVGSAAAVVMGGLMALSGYRKKRRSE